MSRLLCTLVLAAVMGCATPSTWPTQARLNDPEVDPFIRARLAEAIGVVSDDARVDTPVRLTTDSHVKHLNSLGWNGANWPRSKLESSKLWKDAVLVTYKTEHPWRHGEDAQEWVYVWQRMAGDWKLVTVYRFFHTRIIE